MIEFENLTDEQQQALVDAFGEPEEYQAPRFSKVDDPVKAASYEVFRDSMEGMYVEQGEMSDERFDSYLNRGILRQEDGEVAVNSIWRESQVEELQENGMADFDAVSLYESENREDMVVLDTGDGFRFDIRDGALTYEIPGESVEDAEYESGEKVEEITEDFVEFFASVEKDEEIVTGYENDISSKSGEETGNGGERMTEEDDPEYTGDQLEVIVSNVGRLKESLEDLNEDELDLDPTRDKLSDYINQVENLQGQLAALQSEIDGLEGELEENEEAFERYQEVLSYANSLLLQEDEEGDEVGIIPELESRMAGIDTDLDEIYETLDSAYESIRGSLSGDWGSDWDGMAPETASRVESVLDNGEDYVDEIRGMHEDFYDEEE
jgi:tetratricopeptide (TPR) repeat protein